MTKSPDRQNLSNINTSFYFQKVVEFISEIIITMVKLKSHSKLKHWPKTLGLWYDGADELYTTPEEWLIVDTESIRENREGDFVLPMKIKRNKELRSISLASKDKSFLEHLSEKLKKYIGRSLEEIGNLGIEST